jgi:hypothetical protein
MPRTKVPASKASPVEQLREILPLLAPAEKRYYEAILARGAAHARGERLALARLTRRFHAAMSAAGLVAVRWEGRVCIDPEAFRDPATHRDGVSSRWAEGGILDLDA